MPETSNVAPPQSIAGTTTDQPFYTVPPPYYLTRPPFSPGISDDALVFVDIGRYGIPLQSSILEPDAANSLHSQAGNNVLDYPVQDGLLPEDAPATVRLGKSRDGYFLPNIGAHENFADRLADQRPLPVAAQSGYAVAFHRLHMPNVVPPQNMPFLDLDTHQAAFMNPSTSSRFRRGRDTGFTPSPQAAHPRFPCPQDDCDKHFSRKGDVGRHVLQVHMNNRLPCEHCQKTFQRNDHRKKHYLKEHGLLD